MAVPCPDCQQRFVNDMELEEHHSQVHAEKWSGGYLFGQNGDENANGAVSPLTADTLASQEHDRLDANERAERDTKTSH